MRTSFFLSLGMVVILIFSTPSMAVNPSEMLDDPALEARARDISTGLRCVVCQNQSIDDSNAELARDLRILVRERLTNGDSDQAVFDYIVSRYGDYVLLSPPVKASTYALWYGPIFFVLFGIFAIFMIFRNRKVTTPEIQGNSPKPPRLSTAEEQRLQELLDDDK